MAKKKISELPTHTGEELAQMSAAGNGKPFITAVQQARGGDFGAIQRVKEALAVMPHVQFMFGDLAAKAERQLIVVIAREDMLERELLRDRLATLRAELAGANPTPLERLLAERAALCWAQANYADMVDAAGEKRSLTLQQAEFYQRRQERAHQRFLATVKMLATIRRLALPVVQVNVATNGGQQVNVANLAIGTTGVTSTVASSNPEKAETA